VNRIGSSVVEDSIERDMRYLAGELPHRGASTDTERYAAEYIRDRFKTYVPDTEIDDFHAIESYYYLFGAYYAEFLVVSLVAFWWPRIALCYGAVVFLAYLCEFMGYPVFSRLLPRFETQNVIARFLAARPKRLLVVAAHYDSPRDGVFTNPRFVPWLRTAHQTVVVCMLLVLITCATQSVGLFEKTAVPVDLAVRWTAVGFLLAAALALFYSAYYGDYVRGANGNASGAAALLALAQRIAREPLEEADVWLVATGSKGGWMNGMRHFVTSHGLDRHTTSFLVLEHVGAGQLHYVTEEGMLHAFPSAPALVEAAEAVAGPHGATPARLCTVPTDALIPLTRGFETMGIVALDPAGVPPHWHWHTDTLVQVDYALIERAAAFAEAVLRRLMANRA